jgi:hypothetical protein
MQCLLFPGSFDIATGLEYVWAVSRGKVAMKINRFSAILFATAALGLAHNVFAADGVLEISQACASGNGCFPGDDPGFPVQILNSGSYILTSNLIVPVLTHGIATWEDTNNRVAEIKLTINLNGFTISSTTNCTGDPLVCSPTSTTDAYGVLVIAETGGTVTARVHGGQIHGMATGGVACQGACIIENITTSENGFVGVFADGIVSNVTAISNAVAGIAVVNEAIIRDSYSSSNGSYGIFGSGTVVNNVVKDNPDFGIQAIGALTRGNIVFGSDIGIRCSSCSALENQIVQTDTAAIDFENTQGVYGGNVLRSSGDAVVNAGNAVVLSPNACDPVCP